MAVSAKGITEEVSPIKNVRDTFLPEEGVLLNRRLFVMASA
jgi:hypothetical protein